MFQRSNKLWVAVKTVGYRLDESGKKHRMTRSKSGFRTKKEALEYLPKLSDEPRKKTVTFKELYDLWQPSHRAGKSTMNCYAAAMKHYQPIHNLTIDELTIDDLQECLDECQKGKRTQENMKALCGLMYKYAIPRHYVTLNMGPYLMVGGEHGRKDALPDDAVEKLRLNVGKVPWADYVYCHCYLGFRPSELLALEVSRYDPKERAFVGGAKTDAGKDRVVTVSPKIQPIVDRLLEGKVGGVVFSSANGGRISIKTYRDLFYGVLDACGIENPTEEKNGIKRHKYTPHSCRHTFATLMKRVQAAEKDKLELMGHTSAEMLRHYQDVSFEDLRKVTDQI